MSELIIPERRFGGTDRGRGEVAAARSPTDIGVILVAVLRQSR